MHIINSKTNPALSVITFLLFVITKLIHGVLASEGIILTNSVVTDTNPHTLVFFTINITCFAKAFIQPVHVNGVAVISTAHTNNSFSCII